MSVFEFLTTGEAVAAAQDRTPDYLKIIGMRGIEAARLKHPPSRTRAGNMRKPEDPWRAYGDRDKFREIASVMWSRDDGSGEDADLGTITVMFADGETTYLHKGELLCVERPV